MKGRPRETRGYKTKKEGALCLQQIEKPEAGRPLPYVLHYVRGVASSGQCPVVDCGCCPDISILKLGDCHQDVDFPAPVDG